jgi:hypothetical protein
MQMNRFYLKRHIFLKIIFLLLQNESTDDTQSTDRGTLLYSTIKVYQLKAGTLEKIVEYLTNDTGELDTTHMHILFSTYRSFTNTRLLIDTIIARYRAVLPASLDMTEDVRQKTLQYAKIFLNTDKYQSIYFRSLRMAITCLLNAYKQDFYDPPRYSTLNHFLKHIHDTDLQKQGKILLEQLKKDEESLPIDVNNNSKNDYLYHQKGFDYLTPWNILDMSSAMIAEQLTIVDAVNSILNIVFKIFCFRF